MDNILLSLITTLAWSSILILLLAAGRKKNLFREKCGIACAAAFGIICMLRLFLPYDFGLQIQIRCPGIFSDVYEFFVLDSHSLGLWEFCIWDILCAVWLGVAAGLCVRSVFRYLQFRRIIRENSCDNRDYDGILHSVQKKFGKRKADIPICQGKIVSVPMSIGIIRPVILLPEQPCTKEELFCILAHEYTHIRYHDPAWKWLCQILCCIFWWNPFAYLLQRELGELLENRCDLTVVQRVEEVNPAVYMRTIIKTMKNAKEGTEHLPYSALAESRNSKAVKERFQLIAEGYPVNGTSECGRAFFCGILAALVIASYSMVWIPGYDPPIEDFEGGCEVTPENSYIEIGKDGFYYLVSPTDRIKVSAETRKFCEEYGVEFKCEKEK